MYLFVFSGSLVTVNTGRSLVKTLDASFRLCDAVRVFAYELGVFLALGFSYYTVLFFEQLEYKSHSYISAVLGLLKVGSTFVVVNVY